MTTRNFYPIGAPGQPWGDAEKNEWRARQCKQRSYAEEVLGVVNGLHDDFDVVEYGHLNYGVDGEYRLFAIRSRAWDERLPVALVTGGVHGYETSGVHGALHFLQHNAADYAGVVNLLVAPCVSPWGYEHYQRWNPDALDPNRSFRDNSPADESASLLKLVNPLRGRFLLHIDLHETTDSDETEFRPALAAREGKPFEPSGIPDGFYLMDDSENRQLAFQQAIIAAVERVTHIAPADEKGEILGSPVVARGVIEYAVQKHGLCAGITGARYTTTTEVYPDSRATPEQCNAAQATAVCAALDFALVREGNPPSK